jgi:mono/diheme cytochrome c family protein
MERIAQTPKFDEDGSYLFHSRCTSCHTPFSPMRAPWPQNLKLMLQPAIVAALETGKMSSVGSAMSHEQRLAVATYIGRPDKQEQAAQVNACGANAPPMGNSVLWNG